LSNVVSNFKEVFSQRITPNLCITCKGSKLLCGKSICPNIIKSQSLKKISNLINKTDFSGSSPPGIFVGRMGYPKVSIGPLIPPFYGDTEILDTPELWLGKSIQEIIDYRYSLIRCQSKMHVNIPRSGNKLLDNLQELTMSAGPSDSEVKLTKKPVGELFFSEESQPFGPSGPLKFLKVDNVKTDKRIEKVYYDRNLKSIDAAINLYSYGVRISKIQKVFSMGMLGVGSRRKLIPTRWSITAIDDTLSLHLIKKLKQYPTIDEFKVYYFQNLGNRYIAIFIPEPWKFEWIEAWFPGTPWNPQKSQEPSLMGDYEPYWGRTTYASVGGCYYSTRFATAEKFVKDRKQASVIMLREIHPDYILPIGVWNVRESIRATLSTKPETFDSLDKAIKYAMKKLTINLEKWMSKSVLLREILTQKRISEFI